MAPLLADGAHLILRIGGKRLAPRSIRENLLRSIESGLGKPIRLLEEKTTEIAGSQLRAFRPGAAGTKEEFDFHFAVT